MDFRKVIFQIVLLLLLNYKTGESYGVQCTGEWTVDQTIISIGTNLTVSCRSNTVQCGRVFIITLENVEVLQETSCSIVTTQIIMRQPKLSLSCFIEQEGVRSLVCGKDIVANQIPSTPQIMNIVFAKGSLSPTIHWQSSDDMDLLTPVLSIQRADIASNWMEVNVTQLHKGELELLEDLEPLTLYHFELRVCRTSLLYNCSLWSESISLRSPGKAPLKKLDVWRVISRNELNATQIVKIIWKALGEEDYKGHLLVYELVYQDKNTTHILNCSATALTYTLQLPLEVTELNVSAVTSAGSSPPASVSLACLDRAAPDLYLKQAAAGRIHLEWNTSSISFSTTSQDMLGYVVQWQCSPSQVQWKRIEKDSNSTFIQGTEYDGVSRPAFGHIITNSPLNQKGTFNNYKTHQTRPNHFEKSSGSPEVVDVQAAAKWPKSGTILVICIIAAVPIIILVNLLYLKCVRQRLRKACVSVGPSWLFVTLPKLGNSNAIKLLKGEYGSDLCWQSVDCDPPLSPVEVCTPLVERRNSYPTVHEEVIIEKRKVAQDWTVCPYKPQISITSQKTEAASEAVEEDEDEHCWGTFSSPVFKFEEQFLPSQTVHTSLNNCLTLDGRPVSLDVVDGFLFFDQTTLI
ncbi:interleukin-23 receptor [Trichomycterus rosablanca]|uniref:interleukin-23 receptor n=1 Tax=Trichomycterus rosablanca TaxID=2290929 RepID=UPI002F3515B3